MTDRILKYQKILYAVVLLLCACVFYYQDTLPDNAFRISSTDPSVNMFSYYATSLLVWVSNWSGIWVVVPFALLFYFQFIYKIEERNWLIVSLVSLTLLLISFFSMIKFLPLLVGPNLQVGITQILGEEHIFYIGMSAAIILVAAVLIPLILSLKNRMNNVELPSPSLPKLPQIKLVQKVGEKIALVGERFKRRKSEPVEGTPIIKEMLPQLPAIEGPDTEEDEQIEEFEASSDDEAEDSENTENSEVKKEVKKRETNLSKVLKLKKSLASDDEKYYQLIGSKKRFQADTPNKHPDQQYFDNIITRIEEKLTEFRIDGHIINILKGPVVDTFELELGSGVKVSKITSSVEDISLALYGAPIRIVYPMKGRTTVGIEVPRNPREIIYLDEILTSEEYRRGQGSLPLVMGKDAFGKPCVVDLTAMPHMLVAGATGAGKSVFINSVLVSLLVKKSPRQMKLILIDPKQLELALYSKLPHLLMPVMTDAKSASISLLWVVQEMERRYSILKEFGVRNIEGFNKKLKSATPEMLANIHQYYVENEAQEYELPFIIVIVDEFADLILTKAGKEIENNICRLAAKARASGIHLIIATQRPSVDVITGLIKSNFPTRVSFRVTSPVDSRTILNAMGAERLLGKGDMLYKHGVETTRVHSPYVDEEDIEALVDGLSQFDCQFDPGAMNFIENGGDMEQDPFSFGSHIPSVASDGDSDELYDDAVKIVAECRSASASMLQRRLKIGYNRAANLIEIMESRGVVGPAQGSRPRKVLVSSELT